MAATPVLVWAKDGADSKTMTADLSACVSDSKSAPIHPEFDDHRMLSGGALFASVIVVERLRAMLAPGVRAHYIADCMPRNGYASVPLSTAEAGELATQKSPEGKLEWLDHFYSTAGFQRRLAAVATDQLKFLPQAETEPMTIGGLRIDPASLRVGPGLVEPGGVVLRGHATHRLTARLGRAEKVDGFTAPTGTILHEVALTAANGGIYTYWCGGIQRNTPDNTGHYCILANYGTYTVYRGTGVLWLDAPELKDGYRQDSLALFPINEAATDLVGSVDFVIKISRITPTSIALFAEAYKSGDTVSFWTGELQFNKSGTAFLPFWSHQLALARSGDGVMISFTPDGNGEDGWDDARANICGN